MREKRSSIPVSTGMPSALFPGSVDSTRREASVWNAQDFDVLPPVEMETVTISPSSKDSFGVRV